MVKINLFDIETKKMQPNKSLMDYLAEMNRLFPRSPHFQNDILPLPQPPNYMPNQNNYQNYQNHYYQSPIHPTMANQSSSSADSTSPDSFPDMSSRRSETPLGPRRQRPIVGRKIISENKSLLSDTQSQFNDTQRHFSVTQRQFNDTQRQFHDTQRHFSDTQRQFNDSDFDMSPIKQTWMIPEESLYSVTPPKMELSSQHYELFPIEKKPQFKTPVKNPRPPTSANVSPCSSNYSSSNFSPNYHRFETSPRSFLIPNVRAVPSVSNYMAKPRQLDLPNGSKTCTFCRKNGEAPSVYMGHTLKEKIDNRNVVSCPILRRHVCSTCNATGDYAHTNTYCPVQRSNNNGMPLQSTTIILKNTRIKSNGRRRY